MQTDASREAEAKELLEEVMYLISGMGAGKYAGYKAEQREVYGEAGCGPGGVECIRARIDLTWEYGEPIFVAGASPAVVVCPQQ
jgi:hypothetical protein